jgi:hypothetical protein
VELDEETVVVANDEEGVDDGTVLTAGVVEETRNIRKRSWVKNTKGVNHFFPANKKGSPCVHKKEERV